MAVSRYSVTPSGAASIYTNICPCSRSRASPTLSISAGACFAKSVTELMAQMLILTTPQLRSPSTASVSTAAAGERRQPWRSRKPIGISSSAATA